MTFLPIVGRELRIVARRRSTYWGRFGAGATMTALGGYCLVLFNHFGRGLPGITAGSAFLGILASVAFFYAGSSGIQNSADSVSQEKREGTLGLLFLTDLKGYDVAFGKLFSASLSSFYMLLASVPVLAIAIMLGGIDAALLWRTSLALLNLLFFASALGLFISTVSRNARKAVAGAAAVLIIYLIGFPAASAALKSHGYLASGAVFDLINPGHTFALASQVHAYTAPYWQSLVAAHLNAWFFFALASWLLPRSWQEKGVRQDIGWRRRWRRWCYGNSRVRRAFREKLMAVNPFYWLASRTRLGPSFVWLTLVGVYAALSSWLLRPGNYLPALVFIICTVHATLKVWTAIEASHHLEEQRRNGGLESLLACTPLSPEDIIRGQWLALRRQFLMPMIVVLCLDFILSAAIGLNRHQVAPAFYLSEDIDHFCVSALAAMVILAADFVALGWVAMWQAMAQTAPKKAAGAAMSQVLLWPWAIFGLLLMALKLHGFFVCLGLWFVISIALDVILARRARRRLLAEFRNLAADRAEHLGWIGRLGRWLGATTAAARRNTLALGR